MNSFGAFLYELRKEKGMTQAELAERLNVTNKAVSKWETGEAMPDTAQLLPIARIFGVSVDELLAGRRAEQSESGETESKAEKERDRAEDHLFTRGREPKSRTERIGAIVCAALMAVGVAAYLFMGILAELWHPYWVVIPVCAVVCGIVGAACELSNPAKREKKRVSGENPYTGCACAIVMLVCVAAYLLCGALAGLWHPLWLIPVCGALACAVIGAVGAFTMKK